MLCYLALRNVLFELFGNSLTKFGDPSLLVQTEPLLMRFSYPIMMPSPVTNSPAYCGMFHSVLQASNSKNKLGSQNITSNIFVLLLVLKKCSRELTPHRFLFLLHFTWYSNFSRNLYIPHITSLQCSSNFLLRSAVSAALTSNGRLIAALLAANN